MGDTLNDEPEQIFEYYTIVNQENGVINVTLKEEDSNAGGGTNVTEFQPHVSTLPILGPNVKILALNDGSVFLTEVTDDEDNFESIEPHLITSPRNDTGEEETDVSTAEIQGAEYDIIEIKDIEIVKRGDDELADGETYEMVYFDTDTSQDAETEEIEGKKRYKCVFDGCDKEYSTSNHLTVHMRNHTDTKPYACTEEGCNKAFSTNYSLKAHIRTHTGEKPYMCTMCTKRFKTSGDLQKHKRTHTGEKPFLCPILGCGRAFTTSNIRKVHVRSHTGERPYICGYKGCGKAFSSSTNYKNHMRIHSGEKPYACMVEGCVKRFTEYSSLYKHSVVHQTERPFECAFCNSSFKSESAVNRHKMVAHNVIMSPDGIEIVVNL